MSEDWRIGSERAARDVARAIAKTVAYEQTPLEEVEILFAHLKRVLQLGRPTLRDPAGARFAIILSLPLSE